MPRYDFRAPRVYHEAPLAPATTLPLDRDQSNYLVNVLRLRAGDTVLVFNGRDGEWRGTVAGGGKKTLLQITEQTRPQPPAGDLHFLFAPLKHARLDYMIQKAVELGASRLQPVLTRHTQVQRINLPRMRANAIEAAEQCGILALPEIAAPVALDAVVAQWDATRLLVWCDEAAEVADPIAALANARSGGIAGAAPPSVLVGPEGGFAPEEREALLQLANVIRLTLGPRILRADTAAVAALTLVQTVLGDWR
jgi:16S rRNA (uracil1498-N3)-methyltransferase